MEVNTEINDRQMHASSLISEFYVWIIFSEDITEFSRHFLPSVFHAYHFYNLLNIHKLKLVPCFLEPLATKSRGIQHIELCSLFVVCICASKLSPRCTYNRRTESSTNPPLRGEALKIPHLGELRAINTLGD